MLKLLVDEAYAFDYLSILLIKKDLNEKARNSYTSAYNTIKTQMPVTKFENIIRSDEYTELINLNKQVYDLIDRVRSGEKIGAEVVDSLNEKRFRTKQELQKKFFSIEMINEVKSYDVHKP